VSQDTVIPQTENHHWPAIMAALRALVIFDTAALLFAAALHVQGVHIGLGSAAFDEPQIVPAAIVEGLAGGLFAVAAYTVFTGRRWAWRMTLVAHGFAIMGFLGGIFATRTGTSPFNHIYHVVMLGVFVVGLAALLTPSARGALGRRNRRE
jgi:hypothetical protein